MWSDQVSNRGPLALESDVLPTALRGPASSKPFRRAKSYNRKVYTVLREGQLKGLL